MLTSPTHLDMHLQAARAEDGGVDHVPPVRQPHDEDVVQGLDAVQLGEELVYHLSAVGVGGGGCCCFCLEGACICWLCHAWDVVVGYFLGGSVHVCRLCHPWEGRGGSSSRPPFLFSLQKACVCWTCEKRVFLLLSIKKRVCVGCGCVQTAVTDAFLCCMFVYRVAVSLGGGGAALGEDGVGLGLVDWWIE